MKKIGAVFTSLLLALCLCGCNNSEVPDGGLSDSSAVQSSSTSALTSSSSATSSNENSTNVSSSNESSSSSILLSESPASVNSSSENSSSAGSSSSSLSSANSSSSSSSRPTESSSKPSSSVESSKPEQSSSASLYSTSSVQSGNESQPVIIPETDKTLVVYFTWSSNTAAMANTIADLTDADIFEIVPVNPYPEAYTPCTEVALEERDNNARPAIKNLPDSVSEYDKILVGYPIWWHTAPMIIGTFLENYDLTGIDVYPFTQSASMNTEQFRQSMDFVRGCARKATVHDGLFTRYSDKGAIRSYLEENGLTK